MGGEEDPSLGFFDVGGWKWCTSKLKRESSKWNSDSSVTRTNSLHVWPKSLNFVWQVLFWLCFCSIERWNVSVVFFGCKEFSAIWLLHMQWLDICYFSPVLSHLGLEHVVHDHVLLNLLLDFAMWTFNFTHLIFIETKARSDRQQSRDIGMDSISEITSKQCILHLILFLWSALLWGSIKQCMQGQCIWWTIICFTCTVNSNCIPCHFQFQMFPNSRVPKWNCASPWCAPEGGHEASW